MTTTPTDLNDLLLRLYALSQERQIDTFQDAALELVKPAIRFDAAVWGSALVKPGGVDIGTIHLHRKTPEMVLAYEDVKHLDSSSAGMLSQPKLTRGFHAPSFFDAQDKHPIRDFMLRYDQPNFMLSTDYNEQTSFLHWMTLYRSDDDHRYTGRDINVLGFVASHLMQALSFNRQAHLARMNQGNQGNLLYGRGIIDIRGVVLTSDSQFTLEVLSTTEVFQPGRYRVSADILTQILAGAKELRWRGLLLQCQAEADLFFIKSRRLLKIDLLTDRERQIAGLVAKGYTHKEIAATLFRAPATVRNTIQTIYAKLQVNGIAELVEALQVAR